MHKPTAWSKETKYRRMYEKTEIRNRKKIESKEERKE
jgi:hypothetical protein